MTIREREKTSELYAHLSLAIFFGIFLFSDFPLTAYGSAALFYEEFFDSYMLSIAGISIAIAGITLYVFAYRDLKLKGLPEKNSHLETGIMVTSGIYCFVRHPMVIAVLVICLGLMLWKLSIASVVAYIVVIPFYKAAQSEEEGDLIDKFGDEYKKYQQEVPALNIIEGLRKNIYHKHN